MRSVVMAAVVAAALSVSAPTLAATLVDTGVPVPTPYNSWTLYRHQWIAGGFTLSQDAVVTDVQAYLTERRFGEGTLTLSILQKNGSGPPGAELFSGAFTSNGVGFQGLGGLSWDLAAGDYYVMSSVLDGQTFNGSQGGYAPAALSPEYTYSTVGGWFEHDSLNPLAAGWRIEGESAAPGVPEPSAWAIMIAGFALTGAAMRRHRQVAVAA